MLPTATAFDPELALMRCFSNPEMVRETIGDFFHEVDSLFPQLRATLQKGDFAEIGHQVHRMGGIIVCLGAEPASDAASCVVDLVRHAGEPAEIEEAVGALERACEVLRAVLAEYQATTSTVHGAQ